MWGMSDTDRLLAAADLFYDLADEMKERLLEALRDSGINTSLAERSKAMPLWFTVNKRISEIEDIHARVVLEVLLEEYRRYRRLADEQIDSL